MESFHALSPNQLIYIHQTTGAYLVLIPSIPIECPVIIQNIDEVQLMPHSNFVIVYVVGGRNFHCSCPKVHVDCDGVRHDWEAAVDEWVEDKFAMKMLRIKFDKPCIGDNPQDVPCNEDHQGAQRQRYRPALSQDELLQR